MSERKAGRCLSCYSSMYGGEVCPVCGWSSSGIIARDAEDIEVRNCTVTNVTTPEQPMPWPVRQPSPEQEG